MDLERLRREADDQHRLLRVRDLARFGVTPAAGRRLVEDGWLAPVRPGVVLVGGGAPTDWQRAVAAWLAAGPDAALSHWTAARIHRLACAGPSGGAPIDLTVPAPRHPVQPKPNRSEPNRVPIGVTLRNNSGNNTYTHQINSFIYGSVWYILLITHLTHTT